MVEWINSSPGVLSYGDTGFVVQYDATNSPKCWTVRHVNGTTEFVNTLDFAKYLITGWHREMVAVGLVQPELYNNQ